MSDLISRSEVYMNDLIRRKDVLALFPTNDCSDKMVGLYERVLDIPTAYNVDAVVAELGNIKVKHSYNPIKDEIMYKGIDLEEVTSIVRRGGVE